MNAILLARAIAPDDDAINRLPFYPHPMLAKLIEYRVKRLYEDTHEAQGDDRRDR